jgi:hypothetical protein
VDEEGTHERLKAHLRELVNPTSRKFRFARDSPLEGDGFEPSVPQRRTIKSALGRTDGLRATRRLPKKARLADST